MAKIEEELLTDLANNGDLVLSPTGDIDLVSGFANLKLALFHRLLTVPGSLIHRPDYGVGIKNYQNGVNSLAVQQQIALKIRDNFLRDERIEEVTSVGIDSSDTNPEKITITVKVKIRGFDDAQPITFIPFGGEVA